MRGLWWNRAQVSSNTDEERPAAKAFLDEIQADRVHLWLNDQPTNAHVDETFKFADGWTRPGLHQFVSYLQNQGRTVGFTLSPHLPTQAFIDSLDEILRTAADAKVRDIELDLEGNFTKLWGPQARPDFLPLPAAQVALVRKIKSHLPDARIGITSTAAWLPHHVGFQRYVSWVTPQAYGSARAIDVSLAAIEAAGFKTDIVLGLTAEEALISASAFQQALDHAQDLEAKVGQVQGVMIWARRELGPNSDARRILHDTQPT